MKRWISSCILFLLCPLALWAQDTRDPLEHLPALQELAEAAPAAWVDKAGENETLVQVEAFSGRRWLVREAWFEHYRGRRSAEDGGGFAPPRQEGPRPAPLSLAEDGGALSLGPGAWVLISESGGRLEVSRVQVGYENGPLNREARPEKIRRVLWQDPVRSWVLLREDGSLPLRVSGDTPMAPPGSLMADDILLLDLSRDQGRFQWVQYGLGDEGKVTLTPVFHPQKQAVKAGGKPVAEDVPYELDPQKGLARLLPLTSGKLSSGWFRGELLPGVYDLHLNPKTCQEPEGPFTITLAEDGTFRSKPALLLKRGLSLEGMVMDPAGAPIEGAVVSLTMEKVLKRDGGEMRMTLGVRETTTGEDGAYLLSGLLEAGWDLQVKHAEFPVFRKKYPGPVAREDIYLEYGSMLELRLPEGVKDVMAELTPPSVTGEDYFPGRELVLEVNEAGRAGPLPAGSYALFLKAPRYKLVREEIDLSPGRNLLLEPDWQALPVVRLIFQDPASGPLEGVQVSNPFLPNAPGWPLNSDEDGQIVLPDLPTGPSTLSAVWSGASYRVDIPPGDPERATEVTVVIAPPGTVLVQVTPAVRGMDDLMVALIPFSQVLQQPQMASWMQGGNQMSSVMAEGQPLAEGMGQVRLGPAAPGDYLVSISPQGERAAPLARQTVSIQPGTEVTLHLEVKLPREVTLVGFPGEDGEGAWRFGPGNSGVIESRTEVQVPFDADHLIFWPDALYRDGALMVMSRDQLILPLSLFGEADTWHCPGGELSLAPPSGHERIEATCADWPGLLATGRRAKSKVFDLLPPGTYRIDYFDSNDQPLGSESVVVN